MSLAIDRVYELADSDSIEDKGLQRKLLSEREKLSYVPYKWVRSMDAYRVLCPDDPGRIGTWQRHRAIDDAVREGWILRELEG